MVDMNAPRHSLAKCPEFECDGVHGIAFWCHHVEDRNKRMTLRSTHSVVHLGDNDLDWHRLERLVECLRMDYGLWPASDGTKQAS